MHSKKPFKPARPKPTAHSSRVLRELLESAEDLSAHGLVSEPDLARMKALCEEPPEGVRRSRVQFGVLAGKATVPADFDAPLPPDVQASFEREAGRRAPDVQLVPRRRPAG
jgi:hypothetical protein